MTERKRFENDRRRYRIFLTDLGKATYRKALPEVIKLRNKGWEGLTEDDYQVFSRIMDKIFTNFENGS